jgi:hypothetical protein
VAGHSETEIVRAGLDAFIAGDLEAARVTAAPDESSPMSSSA